MNKISMRLIHLFLMLGILLLTEVFPSDAIRQYLVTLLAVWGILHTYQVQRTQNWQLDFVTLTSRTVKIFQYTTTIILIVAALAMWLLPTQDPPTITAVILLISTMTMFVKAVLTPV
jgi:hypothetical protein